MAADDFCYLTTTGRRTGRPHRIEIWYALNDNTLYLLSGGADSSDWVQNLRANPAVQVELDGEHYDARARVIDDDAAERARGLVLNKYAPRSDSDLTGWRQRALPIAVDMTHPAPSTTEHTERRDP